jgi:FkbM family methyltransferase
LELGFVNRQERWYRDNLPLRGEKIVDVGANVGQLSQFFWDEGARTNEVISVEPLAENIKAIEARIRAARAGNKWTLKRCAVSARDGHVSLRPIRADWGHNSMVVEDGGVLVACRRLEAIAPDATVVKVDVEGHEYAFLPQAVAAMPTVKAWALELHCVEGHKLEDTLRMFADANYRLVGAGADKAAPDGPWVSFEIPPEWSWDSFPGVPMMRDGLPSEFKMLHVLAIR